MNQIWFSSIERHGYHTLSLSLCEIDSIPRVTDALFYSNPTSLWCEWRGFNQRELVPVPPTLHTEISVNSKMHRGRPVLTSLSFDWMQPHSDPRCIQKILGFRVCVFIYPARNFLTLCELTSVVVAGKSRWFTCTFKFSLQCQHLIQKSINIIVSS